MMREETMTQPKISLLLPTRKRVPLVKRFLQSLIDTTKTLSNVEIILFIDEDDIESHQLEEPRLNIIKIIQPRCSMGACNSSCLQLAQGEIIMLVNDDIVIRTPHWDEKIIALDTIFVDKIYLAYPNDLFKKKWCSFPILSRRTCELLVEPYPKNYQGAFIDTHLFDVFQRLRKAGQDRTVYLKDVVFEHLHYRTGKAEFDETYQDRGRYVDDVTFITLANMRAQQAQRLLSSLRQSKRSHSALSPISLPTPKNRSSRTIFFILKQFLFDGQLPLLWRSFLCYWFIGRTLASRGWLGARYR